MKFTKKGMLAALEALNQEAERSETTLELCIYGGAAFLLAYDSRAATKDIDAIIKPKEEGMKLVVKVAKELGLHEDWLNDDVKQFIGYRESTRPLARYADWSHLKITVPVVGYLLAMKALACRDPLPGYAGDEEDLRFLIKKMKIQSVDEIQEKVDDYFADDVLPDKTVRRLQQMIDEVR